MYTNTAPAARRTLERTANGSVRCSMLNAAKAIRGDSQLMDVVLEASPRGGPWLWSRVAPSAWLSTLRLQLAERHGVHVGRRAAFDAAVAVVAAEPSEHAQWLAFENRARTAVAAASECLAGLRRDLDAAEAREAKREALAFERVGEAAPVRHAGLRRLIADAVKTLAAAEAELAIGRLRVEQHTPRSAA